MGQLLAKEYMVGATVSMSPEGTARGLVMAPILPDNVSKDTIRDLDDMANPLPQGR